MNSMTKAAFAKRHGVTRQAVQRWEAKGLILLIEETGLVEVEASDARLKRLRSGKNQRRSAAPVSTIIEIPGAKLPGTTTAVDTTTPAITVGVSTTSTWGPPRDSHSVGAASASGEIVAAIPRLLRTAAATVGLSTEQTDALDVALRPLLLEHKAAVFDLNRIHPMISCYDEAEAAPVFEAGTWRVYHWPEAFEEDPDLLPSTSATT